jgi:hypothetical protein
VSRMVKAWMHVVLTDGTDVSVRRMCLELTSADGDGDEVTTAPPGPDADVVVIDDDEDSVPQSAVETAAPAVVA